MHCIQCNGLLCNMDTVYMTNCSLCGAVMRVCKVCKSTYHGNCFLLKFGLPVAVYQHCSTCYAYQHPSEKQKNYCYICKCNNVEISCKKCGTHYHENCILTYLDLTKYSKWMCLNCEAKQVALCDCTLLH